MDETRGCAAPLPVLAAPPCVSFGSGPSILGRGYISLESPVHLPCCASRAVLARVAARRSVCQSVRRSHLWMLHTKAACTKPPRRASPPLPRQTAIPGSKKDCAPDYNTCWDHPRCCVTENFGCHRRNGRMFAMCRCEHGQRLHRSCACTGAALAPKRPSVRWPQRRRRVSAARSEHPSASV